MGKRYFYFNKWLLYRFSSIFRHIFLRISFFEFLMFLLFLLLQYFGLFLKMLRSSWEKQGRNWPSNTNGFSNSNFDYVLKYLQDPLSDLGRNFVLFEESVLKCCPSEQFSLRHFAPTNFEPKKQKAKKIRGRSRRCTCSFCSIRNKAGKAKINSNFRKSLIIFVLLEVRSPK